MTRRRINGFLSLNRAGLRSLDRDYGLTVGARYVYVHLVADADHHDGTMVISVNAWAEEVNLERKSIGRWLRKLSDEGLIAWIPARNQDIPGQFIIPDYDWFTAYADAVPPGTRLGHTWDMLGANVPGALPPTSEKEALSSQALVQEPMRKSRKNQRDIARVEDIRSIVESIGQEPRDTLTYEEQKAFFDAEIKRQQQERQRRQNHEEPELEASEA